MANTYRIERYEDPDGTPKASLYVNNQRVIEISQADDETEDHMTRYITFCRTVAEETAKIVAREVSP